jgi:competence protein ComGC
MNLKEFKQVKSKGGDKKIMKTKIKQEKGITLIALVVTIVVLLILAGVSVNALFGNSGIIEKAKEAQNKMNQATQKDLDAINELNNWIDGKINGSSGGNTTGGNTTGGDDTSTTQKISTLVGKVVDKNTKAEDAYGNKITIPKGFKVLAKGTSTESASYTYSGNNIPAVQDGIVIENGTDGNQFVWVPVGTIKNKDGSTNTITLGRYSNFAKQNGTYVPAQNANNCTQEVTINTYFKELSTFREGNTATDSTAQNATARNLAEFISTSLSNGGYYIARFEASGTASKITSKYNQTVLGNITQPNAAKVAREMYGEVKENNELVYASDLVNSYAWDTAIIFIQTYSTETDASSYASQNKSTSFANTGKSNDKYCNIFDMSGNADEWTTEYSTYSNNSNFYPCVHRGGYYDTDIGEAYCYTSNRYDDYTTDSHSYDSLRSLLYVK